MAHYNHHFRPFVGGSELVSHITHLARDEARNPGVPLDLTGYAIGAEVWWEGGIQIIPSIEIGNLATGDPHYIFRLNEGQTLQVPLGRVAFVKLIRQGPDGVTEIQAPIWLERKA